MFSLKSDGIDFVVMCQAYFLNFSQKNCDK